MDATMLTTVAHELKELVRELDDDLPVERVDAVRRRAIVLIDQALVVAPRLSQAADHRSSVMVAAQRFSSLGGI